MRTHLPANTGCTCAAARRRDKAPLKGARLLCYLHSPRENASKSADQRSWKRRSLGAHTSASRRLGVQLLLQANVLKRRRRALDSICNHRKRTRARLPISVPLPPPRLRCCTSDITKTPSARTRLREDAKPCRISRSHNLLVAWQQCSNCVAASAQVVTRVPSGEYTNTQGATSNDEYAHMRVCAYARTRIRAYAHMRITQSHHDRKRRPQHARASASNLLADASSKHWVHFCCCTDVLNRPSSSFGCLS